MTEMLRRRLDQIRRGKWVVLGVTALCIAVAAVAALLAQPTYTAKSTLMIASPGRATDQDAYVAVAYATLFNDAATQDRLKTAARIPDDVTFEARTAAASAILTVEATAGDPEVAAQAAQTMATAFRDDINAAQQREKAKQLEDLQRQLVALSTVPAPDNMRAADGSAPWNPSVVQLQDRINTLRLDSTNELQDLQPVAGVVETAPSVAKNLVLGTAGGLLLGLMAALGLAAVSNRVTTAAELREKTGVEPLIEVPVGHSFGREGVREDRLRALLNLVSLEGLPKSPALALTDSLGVHGARDIAEEIATVSTRQGHRTVLVYADDSASHDMNSGGFVEALTDSSRVHTFLREVNKDGDHASLKVLPFGGIAGEGYSRLTRERVLAILEELRTEADLIVVAAPSMVQTVRTEMICGATDLTLLVVSKRSSRRGEVVAAAETLAKARAKLFGAVLIDESKSSDEKESLPTDPTPEPSEPVVHLPQ